MARVLLDMGELFLARGRPKDSIEFLRRGLALNNPTYHAEIQLTLARALWAEGRERERAVQLAEEARAHYRRIGHQPMLEAASRWLAGHAVAANSR